jgi:hypothetical protein
MSDPVTPMLTYWGDKRIEDLTRDELIEALRQTAADLQRLSSSAERRGRALGWVEMIKRGDQ